MKMPFAEPLYPVNLSLAGRRCLVVGGGPVALSKARELVVCRAAVDVVAPEILEDFASLDGVICHKRPYETGEVAGYRLVITATSDPAVNRQVFLEGEEAGIWVNSADDPANCAFALPARVRQGPLLVTFSTSGSSPALSTWLRRRYGPEFGPEYAVLVEILTEHRARLQAEGTSTEGLDWQGALDSGMLELIREGRLAEAKERLQACLS
ncbi:MAG: bifunctional precorrin-2 dehydrogenase/sirohydrochlorin ferrochelatase [Actinobacteria bacterium]|jgi:precorrin-2 dehydrogenase/sirohydrochlorin ferrochelatase|nr:bifunctional precorrin-2 dehydrogenase/sirohydrochlorin ferrochelatase [Actinomycetota bacterium]MSW31433.1 bifunctional precorrin-2 dehydrogenase/sirohydrochlorin ferrochelatase [Actinomycetota bacterium]MSX33634.1 bifunctional precorrin-2 dehydrogenase/sirohydrochlorin ferrochelatase [Actinomycetota bacterium]MSX94958.1 bifunctional precorrin-2 dehydrogenase/sirohydrochlorin ferrochelatase [Actinomycetota bacterium]MSY24505.1 bifunctional precorrin-2 dehydrogenase/sirohydrochlorin ferroche